MLQVGFGVGDITPDAGMEMPGGFFQRKGTGVRDKLLAVACVVHDGTTPVALVGIDALFITRPTVEVARRAIQKATRIPGDNVLIGASHTHTGGPITSCLGCDANPAYEKKVADQIAAAVQGAWSRLHAAEIGIGTGREAGISFNRRFLMRDGREITHPGKPGTPHHDDIVAPAGPIDPDVGILAVRTGSGTASKIVGIVVNFACHSTVVGGDQFSPDYAGYLRKHLQAHYGTETPVVFLLGPCGDITQVDNLSRAREFGVEHANMMGMKLASETVRTIDRMAWLADAPTAAAVATVPIAIRPEPDAERERPPYGLGSDNSADKKIDAVYAEERKKVAEDAPSDAALAVRGAGHPHRAARHRGQRRGVFLRIRSAHQEGVTAQGNMGGEPGQRMDRLRADGAGVRRRRLRAAARRGAANWSPTPGNSSSKGTSKFSTRFTKDRSIRACRASANRPPVPRGKLFAGGCLRAATDGRRVTIDRRTAGESARNDGWRRERQNTR